MAAFIVFIQRRRRLLRREIIFQDRNHPLEKYDDAELYSKFRFRRQDILDLTDSLHDELERSNRRGALSPVLQVLLTLRFYATGSFQGVCAELIGVHQTTASRTIRQVTQALLRSLHQWIHLPNDDQARKTKISFYERHGIPNVVGCIDGTQIPIQSPGVAGNEHEFINRKGFHSINVQFYERHGIPNVVGCIDGTQIPIQSPGVAGNEHEFINRKGFHSINVQVICDADLMLINLVAKWPGSVHDARILKESDFFEEMEGNQPPVQGHLLGDSGYMLRDRLITPILIPQTAREVNFNELHSQARCTVERCIGTAKRRWHCLKAGLRVAPDRACEIITACFILHNRARSLSLPDPDSDDDDDDDGDGGDMPLPVRVNGQAGHPAHEHARVAAGRVARNRLIEFVACRQ